MSNTAIQGRTLDNEPKNSSHDKECVIHDHPVPPEELGRYSITRDGAAEQGIAHYVQSEASDEVVQYVEKVKTEYILGEKYEIWDVTTDKDRWWVISNLTNLYSQKHFPSLDYTFSFHLGLMMRIRSRPNGPNASDPSPFDEVLRRMEQTRLLFDRAIEAEEYQTIGMQLRECLISLITVLQRRVKVSEEIGIPQQANFIEWVDVLTNGLCPGKESKEIRQYIKAVATKLWRLVNWLTHARSANKTASMIAMDNCEMIVGHYINLLHLTRTDRSDTCPQCSSRNVRSHYDSFLQPEGAYYETCGVCDWSSHPGYPEDIQVRKSD
ncbi:gamma-glutamylcyclotransferase [Candidatus Saccharibacteria bacterium]|nr:gamma-glutamylcyclotransferase [Candidatus Saccharibacteria bacterium]